MEPKDYTVVKIEGEYAYLRQDNQECDEELFIAMALLPLGVDVGTRLHYEAYSRNRPQHRESYAAAWYQQVFTVP